MTPADCLIPAWDMAALPERDDRPLGFVDLSSAPADWVPRSFPAFPVIGLGGVCHPAAPRLDAVLASPVSAEALLRQVAANPNAAAILVQLLRAIDGMAVGPALVAESLAYGLLQGSDEYARWLGQRGAGGKASGPGRLIVSRQDRTLLLVIDRPQARNAIDRSLRDALYEAFLLGALDPDIHDIRLSGVGAVFSVGGDLEEFGTTRDPASAHLIRSQSLPAHALMGCADKLEVHVQGACVGAGLEMAAFAKRVTAAPGTWFHLPEIAMGLLPGAGGCVSVSRRIGRQRAALMILSGKRIDTRTALAWGLIDAIAGDEGGAHKA